MDALQCFRDFQANHLHQPKNSTLSWKHCEVQFGCLINFGYKRAVNGFGSLKLLVAFFCNLAH